MRLYKNFGFLPLTERGSVAEQACTSVGVQSPNVVLRNPGPQVFLLYKELEGHATNIYTTKWLTILEWPKYKVFEMR